MGKFAGRYNLSLDEIDELDRMVEKSIPIIIDEFLGTAEGWDSFIETVRDRHQRALERLGYPDEIGIEDYRLDWELKLFLDRILIESAERVAKHRIRSA